MQKVVGSNPISRSPRSQAVYAGSGAPGYWVSMVLKVHLGYTPIHLI